MPFSDAAIKYGSMPILTSGRCCWERHWCAGWKDQVAGQGGLNGDAGGFLVADLTDHNNIGVLPQQRPQSAGKRQSGFFIDLHLIAEFQVVFDRVFDRGDIEPVAVHLGKRRIKRRAFAAARGAGNQQNAVRQGDLLLKGISRRGSMPDFSRLIMMLLLSSSRMTTFSPWLVGRTETRRSMPRPPIMTAILPSWGIRRSEISRLAMIFRRETMAGCILQAPASNQTKRRQYDSVSW